MGEDSVLQLTIYLDQTVLGNYCAPNAEHRGW